MKQTLIALLVMVFALAGTAQAQKHHRRHHHRRHKRTHHKAARTHERAPTPTPDAAPDPTPEPQPVQLPSTHKAKKASAPPSVSAEVSEEKGGKGKKKGQVFDFTGLTVEGKMRTPQLLYFLSRAKDELERASLRKRSFLPELQTSVEEDGL